VHLLTAGPVALALALAVASASFTIARTKVFAGPRAWVSRRSKWARSLVACPYCVGHYLCAAAVAAYWPQATLVRQWAPYDYLVSWMAVVAVSALVIGAIGRAIAPPPPASAPEPGPRPW
jgi:hypothetical protein